MRGLGWRKNTQDESHGPARFLLSSTNDLLPSPDLTEFRYGELEQGRANACWGFATARAIQLFYGVRGIKTLPPSPSFLYWNARREEYTGQGEPVTIPDRLPDVGTEPRFGFRALKELGFCAAGDAPYADDLRSIGVQPPDDAYVRAYSQRGMRWYQIEKENLISDVASALSRGFPVEFGMFVSDAFMEFTGTGVIEEIKGTIRGGHMMSILKVDYENSYCLVDNFWGQSWGDNGLGKISFDLLESALVSDIIAIEFLPVLRKI